MKIKSLIFTLVASVVFSGCGLIALGITAAVVENRFTTTRELSYIEFEKTLNSFIGNSTFNLGHDGYIRRKYNDKEDMMIYNASSIDKRLCLVGLHVNINDKENIVQNWNFISQENDCKKILNTYVSKFQKFFNYNLFIVKNNDFVGSPIPEYIKSRKMFIDPKYHTAQSNDSFDFRIEKDGKCIYKKFYDKNDFSYTIKKWEIISGKEYCKK